MATGRQARSIRLWVRDVLRHGTAEHAVRRGNVPASPEAARESFGALIDHRKEWLFDTLPRASAEYHYDIFTKTSQKMLARRLGLNVAKDVLAKAPLADVFAYLERSKPDSFVVKPDLSHSAIAFRACVRRDDLRAPDAYLDLRSGKTRRLASLHRALRHDHGTTRPDAWMLEELLLPPDGRPALLRDYKFYCFGGKAELIFVKTPLGTPANTRIKPAPRYLKHYYTRDWERVKVQDDGVMDGIVEVPARADELLAVAEQAASRLCYPFLRVDLYDTARGVMFGEFTPGPGRRYSYSREWDARLTRLWHEAADTIAEGVRNGSIRPLAAEAELQDAPV